MRPLALHLNTSKNVALLINPMNVLQIEERDMGAVVTYVNGTRVPIAESFADATAAFEAALE